MFTHLGRFVVRRRRLILALTALFVVAAACRRHQRVRPPRTARVRRPRLGVLPRPEVPRGRAPGAGDPDVVLLVDAEDGDVDDPGVVAAG